MSAAKEGSPLKIILAVDGSPHSAAAVNLLSRITWPTGTSILVLAIVPERLPLMEHDSEAYHKVDEALEIVRWRDWAAARIATTEAAASLRAHNLTAVTEICQGRPAQVIGEHAEKWLANLIVIGARGFNPPGKVRLSPTAHKLAQYVNNSVLVARPSNQVRPLSTILAVDGSYEAWRAVEFLGTLALPQWAKVTVITVAEEKAAMPTGIRKVLPDAAEICITRVIERLHDYGVGVRSTVRVGHPADEILSVAQEQKADLIVLGAHKQTDVDHVRWNSVPQKVVKYASCSVLAVRGESEPVYTRSQDFWKDTIRQSTQSPMAQREVPVKVHAPLKEKAL